MARIPVQDRSRARVDRILSAATAILAEVETAATLRSVAARAEVSPGTVYQFFDGMDAVREAVAERARTLLGEALVQGAPAVLAGAPAAFFEALIDTVCRLQEAHPELGCMVRGGGARSAFAEALARDLRRIVLEHVTKALPRRARARRARPDRIGMATIVLMSLLEQAPGKDAADRAAYLRGTAAIAAAALKLD